MLRNCKKVLPLAVLAGFLTLALLTLPKLNFHSVSSGLLRLSQNRAAPIATSIKGTVYDFEVPTIDTGPYYATWKNPGGDLPKASKLDERLPRGFVNSSSSGNPTLTTFMFRGNTSSRQADLFTTHSNAIQFCDKETSVSGCTIRLRANYGYGQLATKLVESLKYLCASPTKSDIYAKIDDDTIISQSELDLLARKLHHSDCKFTSSIISQDYKFYWGVGEIYLFKKSMLEQACKSIPTMVVGTKSEDMQMGQLINSHETAEFCILEADYQHRKYQDDRVTISYKKRH